MSSIKYTNIDFYCENDAWSYETISCRYNIMTLRIINRKQSEKIDMFRCLIVIKNLTIIWKENYIFNTIQYLL